MPILRLFGLLFYVEVFDLLDLFFELDDESYLCGNAEVAHSQEAYCLEEGKSVQFLLISANGYKILKLKRGDLHDVSNIERLNPLRLIKETKNVSHISKFLLSFLGCGSSGRI